MKSTTFALILSGLLCSSSVFAQGTLPDTTETTPEVVPVTSDTEPASRVVPVATTPQVVVTPVVETPPPTTVVGVAAPSTKTKDKSSYIESDWNKTHHAPEDPIYDFSVGGFLRTQFTWVQNDSSNPFLGRGDGFSFSHARVILKGNIYNKYGFRFSLDGAASAHIKKGDSPTFYTTFKDAYVYANPWPFLGAKVGNFTPPFSNEAEMSSKRRPFANLSLMSSGVSAHEGYAASALGRSREIGLQLGAEHYYPMSNDNSPEGLGLTYLFAVTNGNSGTLSMNSNDAFAFYGKIGADWEKMIQINGGFFYNKVSEGSAPSIIDSQLLGYAADLKLSLYGVDLSSGFIMTQKSALDLVVKVDPTRSLGGHASLQYTIDVIDLVPGVRYAYLDPNNLINNDEVHAITAGINYEPESWPFKIQLNYTVNLENPDKQISNDRVDAVVQAQW